LRLTNLLPPPYDILSLSPDGKSAIILLPAKTIPASWEAYEPVFAYLRLRPTDSGANTQIWPAQYALIDLTNGRSTVLVNAPNAWTVGSADMNQAVWSSDSRKLLLTNTYLPLEGVGEPERSRRLQHCAAAIMDVAS